MTQTLSPRAQESLQSIDSLLASIDRTKQASAKTGAEAHTEAGGYAGETTHPVKNVDDRTEPAHEGARSSENSSDVKEDQGKPGVDSTTPGTPGGQDSVQMNVGLQSSATGEDSSVETDSVKGGKDDPGSSHPARTDNDSLDGQKYSSHARHVLNLIKQAQLVGTDLVAQIAVDADSEMQKQAWLAKQSMAGAPAPAAQKVASAEAAEAGSELADSMLGVTKQAQDAVVINSLQETLKVAFDAAEKTAIYLDAYFTEKMAGELEEPPAEEGGEEAGGGAPPEAAAGPPMGGGEPGAGGGEDDQLLDLLSGGQQMGGGEAMGGMAGPGGAGGGGGGGEMDTQALMQLLSQLPPEMLEAALAQASAGGGGAGGMPPGAGGPPPGGDPMAAAGPPKMGSAKWQPKTAAEAQQFRELLKYVNELKGS